MLNWLIFGCFEKCDEPSGDVGFNFGLNVFIITLTSHPHQIIDKTAKGVFHENPFFFAFFHFMHEIHSKLQSL